MLVSNRTDLSPPLSALGGASPGQRLVAAWRQGPGAGLDLSVHRDLDAVAGHWRSFETSADGTVFQTFAWHAAWHAHVGAGRGVEPAIVIGRRGGTIVFLAAFAVEAWGPLKRLVWHAGDMSDYNAPLLAPAFAQVVSERAFAGLFEAVRQRIAAEIPFDAVFLDKMPATVGGQANPFLALGTELCPDGAWRMDIGGDWESFYRDKRSSATRRKDRKKRAKLATFGEVTFESVREPGGVAETLATLYSQKTAWLAAVGAPDFFAKPGHRAFFSALADDAAGRRTVHVARLAVGGATVATAFAMIHRRTYYLIVLTYAQGPMTAWGPGAALLRDLIAYAIDAGCEVFDFTIGDERFKQEWCETRATLHAYSAAASWKAVPLIAGQKAFAALLRLVKQNRMLRDFAMKMRARLLRRGVPKPAPDEGDDGADTAS